MKTIRIIYLLPLCVAFFGSFLFNGINLDALRLGFSASIWTGYGMFCYSLYHKKEDKP